MATSLIKLQALLCSKITQMRNKTIETMKGSKVPTTTYSFSPVRTETRLIEICKETIAINPQISSKDLAKLIKKFTKATQNILFKESLISSDVNALLIQEAMGKLTGICCDRLVSSS